jgi:hypothetical protein
MANNNAPFGAWPVKDRGVEPSVTYYPKVSGTAIYQGDFVIQDSSGAVAVGTATTALLGVAAESRASADVGPMAVYDDPNQIFEIQADGNLVATDLFNNANIVATSPDTNLSRSKHVLQSSSIANTATLPLKILQLAPSGQPNDYGSYARVRVVINNHLLKGGTGTQGAG